MRLGVGLRLVVEGVLEGRVCGLRVGRWQILLMARDVV